MTRDLCYTPATELASRIRRGKLSPVKVIDAFLDRIERYDSELNAFITVTDEHARTRARKAEKEVENGQINGPLHGVPIALKDLIGFKSGVKHTFGAKPFANYVPDYDAVFVKRLEDAGAIVLGKTNTPEFGHKGTTDNQLIGSTVNPFDTNRTAGGSSGGSAAAVAKGMAPVATGSDGGGSIRIPASFCNLYALKPTFGRVPLASRPDAFSHLTHGYLFHAGPITRSVEDAALMLDIMSGFHPRDPACLPDDGANFRAATRKSAENLKIGYSRNLDIFPIDEEVTSTIDDTVSDLGTHGSNIEDVALGLEYSQDELIEAWMVGSKINKANLVAGLKRSTGIDLLGDHRSELPEAYVELLEESDTYSGVEYKATDSVSTHVFDAVENSLEEYDVIVAPTSSVPPFDIREGGPEEVSGEKVNPLTGWQMTYPFNMTGHPVASIPAGFSDDGLPIGMQIIGQRCDEETILTLSAKLEQIVGWNQEYPV